MFWTDAISGKVRSAVHSVCSPRVAPATAYVPMPLGSSSDAPVTKPGPRILPTFTPAPKQDACPNARTIRAVDAPQLGRAAEAPQLRPLGVGDIVDRVFSMYRQRALLFAALSSIPRSEEHTSELQSPCNLVCRLLLEK